MSEPLLTKRLHISGLTPSITPEDIGRRLSSFGNVRAMDGFGARDALGDPRKFGFVTMEIGAKELAKCLNVLSGSTWKGTKLRIGEAKPDFQERLAQINSQPPRPVRPGRTRSRNHGYLSSNLPLTPLSATVAGSTPGWIVTPSGRVVRPMRMRPERPLEPMRSEPTPSHVNGVKRKVKKRVKPPLTRARRRLIDPTKWDSVYLKGVFLDSAPVTLSTSPQNVVDEQIEEETDEDGSDNDDSALPVSSLAHGSSRDITSVQKSPEVAVVMHEGTEPIDIRDEANAALAMLDRMFGDRKDWEGKEMEDPEYQGAKDEDHIEVVYRNVGEGESRTIKEKDRGKEKLREHVHFSGEDGVDAEAALYGDVEMEKNDPPVSTEVSVQTVELAPRANLKALFAPKEDVSFSFINHLDLELDLDSDILGIGAPPIVSQEIAHPSQATLSTPQVVEIPTSKSTTKARSRVTLDPSLPLLFPTQDLLPHPYTPFSNSKTTTHQHGTPSCFLFPSVTRARGLQHLPSSRTFTRSPQDTSGSIRERWEKEKSLLTHEWKRAWREARGSRRGRVGTGVDTGGGY